MFFLQCFHGLELFLTAERLIKPEYIGQIICRMQHIDYQEGSHNRIERKG